MKGGKRATSNTYAGAGVAFDTVLRLICRACSFTLDFASIIEDVAAVDLHRKMVYSSATGTRILDTGSAMTTF